MRIQRLVRSRVVQIIFLLIVVITFGSLINRYKKKVREPANFTCQISNASVSFDMVYIPGGEFEMGSPENEPDRKPDEGPVHKVKVNPFWIGKYEVTWDEYEQFFIGQVDAVTLASPKVSWPWMKIFLQWLLFKTGMPFIKFDAVTRPSPYYGAPDHGWGRGKRPVIGISWYGATKYCEWLSMKTGEEFRLPTEAEWEFACRAGSSGQYYFDSNPGNLGDYAWFYDNSNDQPQEVGQKKPNAFGLYDMLGNVWEFCQDTYDPEYYKVLQEKEVVTDPLKTDKDGKPVLRGGSWDDDQPAVRSARRLVAEDWWNERDPQRPRGKWWLVDGGMVGFRIVRSAK